MNSTWIKFSLVIISAGFLVGCSPQYRFTINEPLVSNIKYDIGQKKPHVIRILDQRPNTMFHKQISTLREVQITLVNMDDPVAWLSQSLEKEFAARDIPVKITYKNANSHADMVLAIKKYQVVSRQVAWLSPWESYHSFLAELTSEGKTCSIRAFFYAGKVYSGTMKEVEEPCFNTPLSILVKEIASKINRCSLHYFASEASLEPFHMLAEKKIRSRDEDAYRPIMDLGNSGNPIAMKSLIAFSDAENRFTRAAAISAMGTLGAQYQFAFLKKKYEQSIEIEKYMALKSIGDIGTSEAIDFVRKAREDQLYTREYGFKHLVDLYLER
ncbi:MAG: hypothetical protein WC539_01740 [Nitrospirota bacterium]